MELRKSLMSSLFYLLLSFLLLTHSNAFAQSTLIPIPYFCGFEDPVENANWVLNYGPEGEGCKDKWIIGSGARSEGRSGLYISTDSISALYGWGYENTVTAYRKFSVSRQMPYDISFDWMNSGAPGTSDLHVLLLRFNDPLIESDSTSAYVISGASDIVSRRRVAPAFNNNTQWKNFSYQTSTLRSGEDYVLMFMWVNSCPDSLPNLTGACIDNIQITSTWCPKPYDLEVTTKCDSTSKATTLSWKGTSSYFEAEYKQRGTYQWNKLGVQTEREISVQNLPEGIYDFRVRALCPSDTSAYVTSSGVVVYCFDSNTCINYIALDSTDIVKCYYSNAVTTSNPNPPLTQGILDEGYESVKSRHTVHWEQDEFDPRTRGRLRTIPPGSYASVRLGTWETGGKMQALEYKHAVDSAQAILLLQYAIVMKDPNHNHIQRPYFLLEIRDEYDNLIDPTCGKAEFYSDRNAQGWQLGTGSGSEQYIWKDWTTVGLNLETYVGQTLTIRLVTRSCTPTAHPGYAYFTLSCASATLKTNTCGDVSEMSISAPEGFKYRWYNPDHPGKEWFTKEIEIPASDSTTYYCDVIFLENDSCYFTLHTKVYPRFPIVDFGYEHAPEDCGNAIRLKNESHVMTMYDGVERHTTEHCDRYLWDFGNGLNSTAVEPVVPCRNEGDTLRVKLTAYLADCFKEDSMTIIVPPIGERIDTVYHEMCYGDFYIFESQYLMKQGTFFDTIINSFTGCDDIIRLELTVHPQYDMPVEFDTVCFGEIKEFAGREFKETGVYDVWRKSQYGCDSILNLNLHVRDEITFDLEVTDVLEGPNTGKIEIKNSSLTDYTYTINGVLNGPLTGLAGGDYTIVVYNRYGCNSEAIEARVLQECLEVNFEAVPHICGDDSFFEITYDTGKGFPTTYDILFPKEAKAAGFSDVLSLPADGRPITVPLPDAVRPDIYRMNIRFEDLLCDSMENLISFTVQYPSSILEQKWNDVIALLNSRYNGGYEFSAIQWYKDGSPLTGETHSYLYIERADLEFGMEYSVLLTRADDGKSLFCCPVVPLYRDPQINLYPLIVNRNQQVTLSVPGEAAVSIYDLTGSKQQAFTVQPSAAGMKFNVSDRPGYYLVIVRLNNGIQESFKIMVK